MDFYEKIRYVCLKIPYGKVASYGQIALLCGKPQNSRQIGYALRTERAGKDIPAHRVVNASGILSGAASFEYPDLQKILLLKEGVDVKWTAKGWQVSMEKYGWKTTLAEAEEFLKYFEENK